jgi:flagellin
MQGFRSHFCGFAFELLGYYLRGITCSRVAVAGFYFGGIQPFKPTQNAGKTQALASTINTNIASLNAQRNLASSGAALATAMQRLSSGLRVNSAKDDAAGLAISERMNTQIKGFGVAVRNANDGISLAQTAEGALGKMGEMLQRARELAVQAANATNSGMDRQALQAEIQQLTAEIDRVAKQTSFNGQKVLDGSFAGAVFQVGANAGDNITVGALADTRTAQLSKIDYSTETLTIDVSDKPLPSIANHQQAIAAGTLSMTVGNTTYPFKQIDGASSSLERLGQILEAINSKTVDTDVIAYTTRTPDTGEYTVQLMSGKLDASSVPLDVTFNGFTFDTTGIRGGWEPTPASYMTALTAAANATPFVAGDFDLLRDKVLANNPSLPYEGASRAAFSNYLASPTQGNAQTLVSAVNDANYGGHYPAILAQRQAFLNANPKTDAVVASYAASLNTHLGVGVVAPTGANPAAWTDAEVRAAVDIFAAAERSVSFPSERMNMNIFNQQIDQYGVDSADASTQAGAWVAIKKVDSAIDQVNSARATLGAVQSRFESAVNNLGVQGENLSAARGRIVDADFAIETANLARTQILQQAGTAMLAQANQIPKNVLQLLEG